MSWFFVLYRSKWAPQDETPAGVQLQAENENQARQHCLDALPSAVVLGPTQRPPTGRRWTHTFQPAPELGANLGVEP